MVCAGDTEVCVPHDCPIGSVITLLIEENVSGVAPPFITAQNDDHVVISTPEEGDFQLRFICCPP